MPRFRIKATARADLKGIAKFTEQKWGREQRNSYLTELDQTPEIIRVLHKRMNVSSRLLKA
jgi:toxin ParE1/3/4